MSLTEKPDAELLNARAYFEEVYRAARKMYAEREVTAQEAALDALGLPLIEFSRQCQYIQVRRPADTVHFLRRKEEIAKRRCEQGRLEFRDIAYDPPVVKYINRMW